MNKVKFKWISRAKFNVLPDKDSDTVYFIYNEHVLYKGDQQYGGLQSLLYTIDNNGNYVVVVVSGDGTTGVLNIASAPRVEEALQAIQNHIQVLATESVSGHTRITDTIDAVNPQDVNSNTAVTPKGVVNFITNYQGKTFLKFPTYLDFPPAGNEDVFYLALDTGFLWIYDEGSYVIVSDNWKRIKEIVGVIV